MKTNKLFQIAIAAILVVGLSSCDKLVKSPKLNTELDSLNYAFGVANGFQIGSYYVQNDSTGKNAAALLKGFRKALRNEDDETLQYYALGINIGRSLVEQKKMGLLGDTTLEMDLAMIQQGLTQAIKGDSTLMSADEADAYLRAMMETIRDRRAEAEFGDNKAAGKAFLEENAKRQGVVTLESGLQYEVLVAGKSTEKPTAESRVKVHYHGTLIDGTVFDSSVDRGTPATFRVSGVIAGWTEALQLMTVGSKWKLYIPYELGYGSQNQGKIKPFSTLIFEVELLGIEK